DLGLEVRAEEGNLYVSPAEKLPATLRAQLVEQKEALLDILCPPLLDSPRTALRRLEKQLGMQGPMSEPAWIIVRHHGHSHSEAELEAVKRRLWAAALAQYQRTQREDDLGAGVLHVGHDACAVCQELHALPLPAQAGQQ